MTITAKKSLRTALARADARTYAPYDKLPAFAEGVKAYTQRRFDNPYEGVDAQAWDRGLEHAMRIARSLGN